MTCNVHDELEDGGLVGTIDKHLGGLHLAEVLEKRFHGGRGSKWIAVRGKNVKLRIVSKLLDCRDLRHVHGEIRHIRVLPRVTLFDEKIEV